MYTHMYMYDMLREYVRVRHDVTARARTCYQLLLDVDDVEHVEAEAAARQRFQRARALPPPA